MFLCKQCREYCMNSSETCHCQEFVVVDTDGETHKYYAANEHDAATKYAKHYNEGGDYPLMDESVVVEVLGPEGSKLMRVSAEHDIHYSCNEVPNAKPITPSGRYADGMTAEDDKAFNSRWGVGAKEM